MSIDHDTHIHPSSIVAQAPAQTAGDTMHIPIPPPPPLIPDDPHHLEEEETNTLALLLPHTSLFAAPILELLRSYYETNFGRIAHWAPVKGFGRVIVVFESTDSGERAKRHGDRLWLDVAITEQEGPDTGTNEANGSTGAEKEDGATPNTSIRAGRGHKRRASQPHPRGGYVFPALSLLFSLNRLGMS